MLRNYLIAFTTITLLILSALIMCFPQKVYALDPPGNLVNPSFEDGTVPDRMAWTRPFDPVDQTGGLYTSLALDPLDNTPHISYYDDFYGDLKYATLRGGVWIIETVDSGGDVGLYTSIAFEPRQGLSPSTVHISYYDRTNGNLKYATKSGTTGPWIKVISDGDASAISTGGTLGDVGLYTSITLDTVGNPYISYYAESAEEIRLAYRDGPSWHVESGPDARIGGESTAIIVEPRYVTPIIAYFDLNGQNLKLAMYDRGEVFDYPVIDNPYPDWGVEIVGSGGSLTEDVSMTLDSIGEPHISYSDSYATGGTIISYYKKECLYNALFNNPTSNQPTGQGTWNFEIVDSIEPVRGHTSIAVDEFGNPHISYSGLRHASKSGNFWNHDTVDSGFEVGLYTSITLDSDDNPHISYYDASNDEVKYVRGSPPTAPIDPWQFGLNPVVAQSDIVRSGSFAVAMPKMATLFQDISPPACAQSLTLFGIGSFPIGPQQVVLKVDYSGGPPQIESVVLSADLNVWGETIIDLDQTRLVTRVMVITGVVNPIEDLGTVVDADGHTPIPLGIVLDDFELVPSEPYTTVSAASATGVGDVTFSTSAGQFQSLTAFSEEDLPPDTGRPTGVTFPFGLFSWTISNLALGETVTVTTTFPSNIPSPSQYWKVIDGVWTDVSSLVGNDDGDSVLTITITDGGLGDTDGVVNGEISDPGGVAIVPAQTVLLFDTSGSMSWRHDGNHFVPLEEQRWSQAKLAAELFLDLLGDYTLMTQIGVATFPHHPWPPDQGCIGQVVTPLTLVDASTINTVKATINGLQPEGNTPLLGGVETAKGMFFEDQSRKAIILLSDGYQNCPPIIDTSDDAVTSLISQLRDESIVVNTIGFARPIDLDEPLLTALADETQGIFHDVTTPGFDPDYWDPGLDLQGTYTSILVDLLGLEKTSDPFGTICPKKVVSHEIHLNEFDEKVSFILSWSTKHSGRLGLTVRSSDGQPIRAIFGPGITFHHGENYEIITVGKKFLDLPGKVGSTPWTLEIDGDNITVQDTKYQYGVISSSYLKMNPDFQVSSLSTGTTITLTLEIQAGTPVVGLENVNVKILRPEEGRGNWFAAHQISSEELNQIPETVGNETLSLLQRKASYLVEKSKVDYLGRIIEGPLKMYDDGTHGDAQASDGIYSITFSETKKEGTYTFYFHANGTTAMGNTWVREKQLKINLTPNFSQEDSDVEVLHIAGDNKVQTIRVNFIPKDALGNYLGPAYTGAITIDTQWGQAVTDLEDNLDGTYSQTIELPSSKAQETKITVKLGNEIMSVIWEGPEVEPEPSPWPLWKIAVVVIIAILLVGVLIYFAKSKLS